MDRRAFLGGSAAVLASLGGCTGVLGSGSTPEFDVGMRAKAFVPRAITVEAGDSVVWYNNNDRPHTVTAYENAIPDDAAYFASGGYDTEAAARAGYEDELAGTVDPGETYERTFEVAGTYEYFCVPHEGGGMIGTVTVESES